ncbi:probable molybdenum cofactor biosynthesis protein C [Methanocella paludicola SANAE]|uniref:Probable cyclic pyranopterin monophosphate synthase n=1 Tax=Methanocella paludicola (strain DSM 17711 / JCM 13418 / NBRC 101707 / SANAE) TaxID=304371 RepID=D1YWH9_METPS|nr:cyclic pyranopterin monophosphate synthase MoaC [Methanocella paludicola]BAI60801.1 probable molybdenum cofactor biosynthesis protein C [Methanocella paludicola SANAE]
MRSTDFTHVEGDKVKMVDVGSKEEVVRIARASGTIHLTKETMALIKAGNVKKGNVLAAARIAAIQAAKHTWETIPLCHQIPITGIDVEFEVGDTDIKAIAEVRSVGKTGVEMEALCAVSTALLTIWDMVKAVEKDETGNYPETKITNIVVDKKIKAKQ